MESRTTMKFRLKGKKKVMIMIAEVTLTGFGIYYITALKTRYVHIELCNHKVVDIQF